MMIMMESLIQKMMLMIIKTRIKKMKMNDPQISYLFLVKHLIQK